MPVNVLDQCTIATVDPERRILHDGAIAFEERIVAIGPSDEIRSAYQEANIIDARGRVVFPGFINTHTHTVLSILRGQAEDLGGHSLYGQMYPMKSLLTAEDRYVMGMLGCLEGLRFGTTCITENYEGATDVAPAIEKLGMRGVVSEIVNDAVMVEIRRGRYEFSKAQAEQQLERALDLVDLWHGFDDGRITVQLSAHAPDTCSRELLEQIREISDQRSLGRHIHLAQTQQEIDQVERREGMRSAEFLETTGFLGPRTIAAHCVHLMPHEIELVGKSGTNVAHCALIIGKRGSNAPILGLEAAGANIGMGSDNMSDDIVDTTRHAMISNRVREHSGTTPHSHHALDWLTIGGAKAVGLDHEIGSLETGKKADITVVDFRQPHLTPVFDPVANFIHCGLGSDVEMVFVDGKQLVASGKVQTIDTADVIAAAQQQATYFWQRFDDQFGGTVMSQNI